MTYEFIEVKMKKKNKIYCVFCGTANELKDKKCKKCNKQLNPKNHLFKDYLKDHIKDDVKSNIQDSIIELIEEWIKAHLFGIFFSASLLVLVAGIAINEANISNTKKTFAKIKNIDKPITYKATCSDKELVDKILVCDAGYNLNGDKCTKTSSVNATSTKTCQSGYYLNGNQCISNSLKEKDKTVTCSTPAYDYIGATGQYVIGGEKVGETCYRILCTGIRPTKLSECVTSTREEMAPASVTYSCNGYTDSSGNCHYVTNFTYKYSCANGTLNGKTCVITNTVDAKSVCPDGTVYSEECGKCEKVNS